MNHRKAGDFDREYPAQFLQAVFDLLPAVLLPLSQETIPVLPVFPGAFYALISCDKGGNPVCCDSAYHSRQLQYPVRRQMFVALTLAQYHALCYGIGGNAEAAKSPSLRLNAGQEIHILMRVPNGHTMDREKRGIIQRIRSTSTEPLRCRSDLFES
jgi:hypothetical protein